MTLSRSIRFAPGISAVVAVAVLCVGGVLKLFAQDPCPDCPKTKPNDQACIDYFTPCGKMPNDAGACNPQTTDRGADGDFGVQASENCEQAVKGKTINMALCFITYSCTVKGGFCQQDNNTGVETFRVVYIQKACPPPRS